MDIYLLSAENSGLEFEELEAFIRGQRPGAATSSAPLSLAPILISFFGKAG